MNMTRVTVCCLFLLSWASLCPIQAQEPFPVAETVHPSYVPPSGYASIEPSDSYVPYDPLGIRFRTRSDIGDGVGYQQGYQSFSAFLPAIMEQGRSLIFLDARGIATYKGDLAANIGAGLRVYSPEVDRVFGAAFWYDTDESGNGRYDQFGISAESLGKYFDIRANAYLPTNDNQREISSVITGGQFFQGSNIFFNRTALVETALSGGDFEVGGALPGIGDYGIRTYVGGYYYQGRDTDNTYGVKFRAEALVTEDLSMQVGVTNDDFFGTNVTMAVSLQLPDGKPMRILSRQPTQERMYAAMDRNYRVAIRQRVIDAPIAALRAGGQGGSGGAVGTPIVVAHVDNTAAAGGDGSFETPFSTLPTSTASNVDIVFVRRGDGTATGYDNGIALNNNQRLLGEGLLHQFTSTRGVFDLPGFTAGPAPIITNTSLGTNGGNAVVLANNNEVSNFTIGGTAGSGFEIANHGISGGTVASFDINNVLIQNAGAAGINITNASGTGSLNNVSVNTVVDNGILVGSTGGGTLNLDLDTVDVTGAGLSGINLQASNNSTINAEMVSVTSDGNDTGLSLIASTGSTIDVTDTTTGFDLSFSNNSTYGVFVDASTGSTVNLSLSQDPTFLTGDVIDGNGDTGLLADISGASVFNLALEGTSVTGNTIGNGIDITATGNSLVSFSGTNGVTVDGNGGDGIGINLNGSELTEFLFDTGSTSSNGGSGINLVGTAGSVVGDFSFLTSTADGNGDSGISVDLTGGTLANFLVDSSSASNNVSGAGVSVILSNLAATSVTATNNDLNANGTDGVFVSLLNGATIDTVDISNNSTTISTNGDDGIHVNVGGNAATISALIVDNNVLDANVNNGINITGTNGVISSALISNNTVTNSVNGSGLNFNMTNAAINTEITGNTFTGNANTGITFSGNTALFDLTVGGTLADANVIDQNAGAGLVVDVTGNSVGTLDIQNNTITQSTNIATNAFLNGEGISIRTRQNASIANSTIANNTIGDLTDPTLGNAGTGILFQTEATSQLLSMNVANNDIGNNGAAGVGVLRTTDSVIDNFTITSNTIQNNAGNGVDLEVRNGNGDTLDFTINLNDINNNANGIQLFAREDALLLADITQNVIDSNNGTGILVINTANDITDTREVGGTWTKNTITNNTGHGIQLLGSHGVTNPLTIGQIGNDPSDGLSLGNTITDNGLDGISVDAPGVVDITNNTIMRNQTGGIDVNSLVFFGNTLAINYNTINENVGDGVELNANDINGLVLDVTMLGNEVNDNTGRGIDLLNQVNATTLFQLGDGTLDGANFIQGNDLEGIYIVNTASATQDQTSASTTALLANGSTTVIPNIVFDMQRNFVDGNGNNSGLSGTGLVLRVGTANSDLLAATAGTVDGGLNGIGQVNARITNNRIAGSNGVDVFIESFRSTNNPITTAGTWNNTPSPTAITAFENDPLARLNLVFTGNTGNALNVTRLGANYANSEGVFKSRLNTATPGGPFTSATRRRNAQRVPGNVGVPAGTLFPYPGMGLSTFQIEADFDVANFASGDTFLLDSVPVPPTFNANGVNFNNAIIGELPYGWSSVAPGSFIFP